MRRAVLSSIGQAKSISASTKGVFERVARESKGGSSASRCEGIHPATL